MACLEVYRRSPMYVTENLQTAGWKKIEQCLLDTLTELSQKSNTTSKTLNNISNFIKLRFWQTISGSTAQETFKYLWNFKFITLLTRARHKYLSWVKWIQSTPLFCFCKIYFNFIFHLIQIFLMFSFHPLIWFKHILQTLQNSNVSVLHMVVTSGG